MAVSLQHERWLGSEMIFRKQLCAHNPPESYGDCYRTAIGCLIDMEPQDVPHFMAMHADEGEFVTETQKVHIREWLAERGYTHIELGFHAPQSDPQSMRDYVADMNGEDVVYTLSGCSVIGSHVVICRGRKILWDPSPFDSGIVSGYKDHFWVGFVVPVANVRYTP